MALPFEERSISGGRLGGFGSGRKKREFLAELESELARFKRRSFGMLPEQVEGPRQSDRRRRS